MKQRNKTPSALSPDSRIHFNFLIFLIDLRKIFIVIHHCSRRRQAMEMIIEYRPPSLLSITALKYFCVRNMASQTPCWQGLQDAFPEHDVKSKCFQFHIRGAVCT